MCMSLRLFPFPGCGAVGAGFGHHDRHQSNLKSGAGPHPRGRWCAMVGRYASIVCQFGWLQSTESKKRHALTGKRNRSGMLCYCRAAPNPIGEWSVTWGY